MKRQILGILSVAWLISVQSNAQSSLKTPAPSPLQTVTQAFGLGEIKIEYSRPSVKGRVIFGDLVPYGKIWRTGANQSTKITLGDDIKVNNTPVAAGTYALYTIPGQSEWDVMLYKDLTLGGGVADYKTENELMRFKVKSESTMDKMETFLININNITPVSCTIDLCWDKTKVSIPVSTEIDSKIMSQIDKEMSADKRPYYTAANYYYENNKDMNKALEWANKAIDMNPNAFWITHLKAKILVKLKDYPNAIKTAEASRAKALEEKEDGFVKQNDQLIADVKKLMK